MVRLGSEFKAGHLSAVEFAGHLGEVARQREELTNAPAAEPVEGWVAVQKHVQGCAGGGCACPALIYAEWSAPWGIQAVALAA